MKRKEMKNLAVKIAELEMQLDKATDSDEQHQLQRDIDALCAHTTSFNEMMEIDELVQEYIESHKEN